MDEKKRLRKLAKESKGWIGYRPEIKVLDCTIRDGGLMNDHKFSLNFGKALYKALSEAGVDYIGAIKFLI